ncbi:MAG TPA: crossover junction endodeoxyribonuclease RuvC [Syntrophothermus lipocalidus]|nr:crossover junction endodeoxyribonuclease RuvC [Syntrophothermus lipocalidus]
MIVLGIDPGTATTGYGVLEDIGGKARLIDYGVVRTSSGTNQAIRLLEIHNRIEQVIQCYSPSVLAVEELFFSRNAKTAITVGQARGVVLMTAAERGLVIYEYTPLEVKQAVVGFGNADKRQVQAMVKAILQMKEIPKPDDAADALAVAICHIHAARLSKVRGTQL